MRSLVAVLLAALCPLLWAAPQVLHRGNAAEPATLDPHRSEGVPSGNILRDLFEGLSTEAPDGRIVPGVAQSWQVSEDGLRWTFALREDARWSNGDPVTAEDFVWSLRRSVDPATGSNYSRLLSMIRHAPAIIAGRAPPSALGVRAIDARTLLIELEHPTPYLPAVLAHSAAFPVHRPTVEAFADGFDRPGRLVGNGAYVLTEWRMHARIRLDRNRHYWNDAATRIDTVYYYPTENPSSELKRYRAGELHWTDSVPRTQVAWIREHLPAELHIAPYLGTYYYGLNLRRAPFAGNPALRKALALAVDREALTERLLATGELPAYAFVPPDVAGYAPPQPEWATWPAERRLAEARRLYAEAGYSPERPLEIELRYNTQENHRRIAIAVAWMWRKALGVRTTLVNEEWKVFLQNRRFGRVTQVFRAAWIGDFVDPVSFLQLFAAGSELNDTGWSSPRYDALLEAAARAPDADARAALLSRAEAMMLEDQPIIPLFHYVSARLVKPALRGWQPNLLDHHYTRSMYFVPDPGEEAP